MEAVIRAESLVKHYRRPWGRSAVRAVDGVSLVVEPGSAFGLLGPNGAGKTTFVKMLLSAVRPTSGRALLFGRDAHDPAARRQIGYLPENHRFPTYHTGRQMLDFYAALSGMSGGERKRRADELLERVGLADRADDRIGKYSKGMLQRLGLAQALMHRPRLLILDEPGDGVDPVGRRMIRDVLREQQRDGVTIFLNSHLLAEVETSCDEVAIIRRGEVALTGSLANLTHSGGYRVTAVDVDPATREALRAHVDPAATQNGSFVSRYADRDAANAAVDRLRSAGAAIEAVEPQRSTLEDVFLGVIEEEKRP